MADADLVLEGGGVKGAGLAGAVAALAEVADPYTFHRIAGTSAGAIVASFLAAGYTPGELKQVMVDLDFAQFEDESTVFNTTGVQSTNFHLTTETKESLFSS